MQKYEVEIDLIETKQLSEFVSKNCFFCHKLVKSDHESFKTMHNMTGNRFYCPFCIRNNFHHRSNRNILAISYRGIFGFYYYGMYLNQRKLWWSEINSMIENHIKIGTSNPVFIYDPETFMWFIDFNKIGSKKRKLPYHFVKKTAKLILESFHMSEITKYHQIEKRMWQKFEKSLDIYHEKRQRPKNRKFLIPTFSQIMAKERQKFFEKTREFLPRNFNVI